MINLILFGTFFIMLLLNIPIAVSLGSSAILAMLYAHDPFTVISTNVYNGMAKFLLLAIPFFVLSGNIMAKAGISTRLVNFIDDCVGHRRGGIAIVCVIVACFFGAISGSGPATVAAIGGLTIPTMIKQGYDTGYSGAIAAAAGSIGVVIPPSIPMVMYSVATGASVGALFLGGIVPGLIIGLSLMLYTKWYCTKRQYINKESQPFSWRTVGHSLADGIWALLVPVIILGGIYGGIFTPTEAAAVAVAYGLIIGAFVYKELKFKDLVGIFANASLTTATIMIILGTANTFGRILTMQKVPGHIAAFFQSITDSRIVILLLINLLLLFVGCFMETNAAIIILAPIFLPVVQAMGVDPVHFGIVMVINLAIGFITPPLGVNLFVAANVAQTTLGKICRGIVPIIGVMILDLMLFTYLEPIVMFLPRLVYG